MGTKQRRTNVRSRVAIVFEPSRLAADYLAEAYARVVPFVLRRTSWLFAGSLRAGQRAAAVMTLVHSARLNGHHPYAYIKDVLERLPTLPASRIGELLLHRWQPPTAAV
jgi:hypothetical protein